MDPRHLTLLRVHDACRGLSADEIDAIAAEVEVVHAGAGELIHSVGQSILGLSIVVSGRLEMVLRTSGGGRRTLRYLSAGDQFGAMMLVSEDEFPVDVVVDEPAVLLQLRKESAIQLVNEIPVFRRNLLRKIGMGVRDLMHSKRRRTLAKIVTFVQAENQSKKLFFDVASQLARTGEKIGMLCDWDVGSTVELGTPFRSLRDQAGKYVDQSEVLQSIEQWPHLNRILIAVDRSLPAENLALLVALSDAVFFFSGTNDFHASIEHLKRLTDQSPSWKKKTHYVWLLGDDEQVAPLVPELPGLTRRDFKIQSARADNDSRFGDQGVDRIVHYLRDVSIGLALSGGAAHGMAHLGVLRAFEEAGITIDRIAGTSAGVLTGVLYCAGYSPSWGVNHFTKDLEPGSIYKWLPKGESLYMLEKYRSHAWDEMLRNYLTNWRLEQLPIPVSTVTTDLISAQSVARSSGDAVDSILESINLPVLSPPICRDGMLLVDGGIVNNLPADILVKQGCNFVIGVDVAANIEHHVGDNFPDTPTSEMEAPGAMATLLRCLRVQAHNMSGVGAAPADVIIAPDVSMFESTAFTKTPEMTEIGYRATVETLPRIREVLHNLDADLFAE